MADNVKTFTLIIVSWAFLCCCLSVPDCAAQGAAASDKASPDYFTGGVDIISYQITEYSSDKDYAAYSQLVREKIRQRLESAYKDYYKDGDVNLFFIINSDGRLAKFHIDHKNSTDDKRLIDIAVLGLEGSSPFPPFPKRLYADRLPFSVLIVFKEK